MRIGINTLFLVPGDVGGTEIYLREILKHLIPANAEDEFILFTSLDNEHVFRNDLQGMENVGYARLPLRSQYRPLRILAEQFLLPFVTLQRGIDVLWSPGYTAPLVTLCSQAVTIHDLQYKTHPEDLSTLERLTLDFLVKAACRRCRKIITISDFSKNELIKYGFAPAEKISAIASGVNPSFAESNHEDRGVAEEVKNQQPYILCVAHTYPHKNVAMLVEAFAEISRRYPHRLILVGKARRGEAALQNSLQKLEKPERVLRFDTVSSDVLRDLYQNADIFVFPSVYEGFGLPLLEAMLAGTPVVTTNKTAIPEVGGQAVFYTTEVNAKEFVTTIGSLLEMDSEKRKEWVAKAKAWAGAFTWEATARRLGDELHGLVRTKKDDL